MYFHCVTNEHPTKWLDWLSWAEYCYNALHATPFEMFYGHLPPCLLSYTPGSSVIDIVDHAFRTQDVILSLIRANPLKAQQKIKASCDKHHHNLAFQVGDKVLLHLQPYHQASLTNRRHQKLLARFYKHFTVLRRIGKLAYELVLPATSKLHPIFCFPS